MPFFFLPMDDETPQMPLAEKQEFALQQQYIAALIQRSPGLGEVSNQVAQNLIASGITPAEAFLLIQAVYTPTTAQGKGQGNKVKHFGEALERHYGDVVLHNASKNVAAFQGLLARVTQAVDMRDSLNGALVRSSFSFDDALRFQKLGLDQDTVMDAYQQLQETYGLGDVAATMRIKEAVRTLERGGYCTLEGVLFFDEAKEFVTGVMETDSLGRLDEEC